MVTKPKKQNNGSDQKIRKTPKPKTAGQKSTAGQSPDKTVLGIDRNIEALLCYVLGWVSGIVFLLLEKENKFVRFHAMQSLVTFMGLFIISILLRQVPIIGWLIAVLSWPLQLVLWIFLMYKAFQDEMYKLPVIGDFAEQQIDK